MDEAQRWIDVDLAAQERLAYEQVIMKLRQSELTLPPGKENVKGVLERYRELLTVFLLGSNSDKGQYVQYKGLYLWGKDDVTRYERFSVKPYSFYGVVDRASFGDDDPQDWRTGTYEIMDIVPGFGVVSIPPADFLKEMKKVYRDVIGMTPEKLLLDP